MPATRRASTTSASSCTPQENSARRQGLGQQCLAARRRGRRGSTHLAALHSLDELRVAPLGALGQPVVGGCHSRGRHHGVAAHKGAGGLLLLLQHRGVGGRRRGKVVGGGGRHTGGQGEQGRQAAESLAEAAALLLGLRGGGGACPGRLCVEGRSISGERAPGPQRGSPPSPPIVDASNARGCRRCGWLQRPGARARPPTCARTTIRAARWLRRGWKGRWAASRRGWAAVRELAMWVGLGRSLGAEAAAAEPSERGVGVGEQVDWRDCAAGGCGRRLWPRTLPPTAQRSIGSPSPRFLQAPPARAGPCYMVQCWHKRSLVHASGWGCCAMARAVPRGCRAAPSPSTPPAPQLDSSGRSGQKNIFSSLPPANGHLRNAQLAVGAAGGQLISPHPGCAQHLVGMPLQRVQRDGGAEVPQLGGTIVRSGGHMVCCCRAKGRGRGEGV